MLRRASTELVVRDGEVLIDGERVELAPREREVLDALLAARGRIVTKEELADSTSVHAVEVAVSRLRDRLGAFGGAIVAVRRRGYRLEC